MQVIIIYASPADQDWVEKITSSLTDWNLKSTQHMASAHKVPERVFDLVQKYNEVNDIVYVTIAGRSNGLSGVVAANSIHPVIACPPFKDKADMMTNIHSTLQMPSDTPVLTVLDPTNVAAACARMLGLTDKKLQKDIKNKIAEIKQRY